MPAPQGVVAGKQALMARDRPRLAAAREKEGRWAAMSAGRASAPGIAWRSDRERSAPASEARSASPEEIRDSSREKLSCSPIADVGQNVKVCCRVRPELSARTEDLLPITAHSKSGMPKELRIARMDGVCEAASFAFDRVFPATATQSDVYESGAKDIIEAILQGFHGTVLAYGPTSSGKTYTMEGDLGLAGHSPDRGIIPRMVDSIFAGIAASVEKIEFTIKVSIVEIYNEKIRDLLSDDPASRNLKIHESLVRGIFIEDVTEEYVGSPKAIFEAIQRGHAQRAVATTNVNEHSSRSHLIFMLTVEQRDVARETVKVGKLHLVDLAGAEKVSKSGASGERLDEAKNINRSLSALGNVILALCEKQRAASASHHVPYRDSKLTRVLQESLGGNAKTCLIVTISPLAMVVHDTLSSLRFGCRAKLVRNSAAINQVLSAEQLQLLLRRSQRTMSAQKLRIGELERMLRLRGIFVPGPRGGVTTSFCDHSGALCDEADEERVPGRASPQAPPPEAFAPPEPELSRAVSDNERITQENIDCKHEVARVQAENQVLQGKVRELGDAVGTMAQALQAAEDATAKVKRIDADRRALESPAKKTPKRKSLVRKLEQLEEVLEAHAGEQATEWRQLLNDVKSLGTPEEDNLNGRTGSQESHGDVDTRERERRARRMVRQIDEKTKEMENLWADMVKQNERQKVELRKSDRRPKADRKRITELERQVTLLREQNAQVKRQEELSRDQDALARSRRSIRVPIKGGSPAERFPDFSPLPLPLVRNSAPR